MIAGGVGLVGYLVYRAKVSTPTAAPVTGQVGIPPRNATLSASGKAKLATITAAGVQATTASS